MSHLRSLALAAVLLALPSCSLVVGSEEPIPCTRSGDEDDPCPEDMTCVRRVCVPLDCDADGDGVGCDGVIDCDDTNRNAYPGAPEVCDGRDNDCNDRVDDDVCASGETCSQRGGEYRCLSNTNCYTGLLQCMPTERCSPSGECMPRPASDCRDVSCAADRKCDTLTGDCLIPLALGAECMRDVECATDHCFPRDSLRDGESGRVCSAPCASSEDCTEGVCFASGTGVRGCVPSAASPELGVCARNSDCGMGSCRVDESALLACGASSGGLGLGMRCDASAECASGICAYEPFSGSYCRAPCGTLVDCPTGQICRFRDVTPDAPDFTWVTVCDAAPTNAPGTQGSLCTASTECYERYCAEALLDAPRYCAEVCTQDSDCSAEYACRPVDNNGWELRCLRR